MLLCKLLVQNAASCSFCSRMGVFHASIADIMVRHLGLGIPDSTAAASEISEALRPRWVVAVSDPEEGAAKGRAGTADLRTFLARLRPSCPNKACRRVSLSEAHQQSVCCHVSESVHHWAAPMIEDLWINLLDSRKLKEPS